MGCLLSKNQWATTSKAATLKKIGSFYNKIEDFCSELSKITLLSISPITET